MEQLIKQLGGTDIYLLDQLMKGNIRKSDQILDAWCGSGRNCAIFIRNDYSIFGIDKSETAIADLYTNLKTWNPKYKNNRFKVANLEQIPFEDGFFDFVICSAVLHFSKNRIHFREMFKELTRVVKNKGILWFRMTSKHTIENFANKIEEDVYVLPDGSTRYLLDRQLLYELMNIYGLNFLDPFKTVNVNDIRTMSTIVLQKA